jgi:CDP-diacylglycerol--glycerol-3-phosphate 3-phosphatidyltransferase
MLNNADVRKGLAKFIDPAAKKLLDIGVTPDMITYAGTLGVSATALWFFPRGQFTIGVIVILLFIFSDLLDGTMARMSNRAGPWGNFLDSTLDRIADGAVFGGFLIYFASRGESLAAAATWVCLVGGFTISYAKARAESVGATANVGIAERAERLILVLAAAFIAGFGVSWILPAAVIVLAVLVLVTIGQRFAKVKSQLHPTRSQRPDSGHEPDHGGDSP